MKEEKIQLMHPEGKKLPRIDKAKYDILEKAILSVLKRKPLTHTEMKEAVLNDLKKKKIKFEGAVEWYMEGVKLHLETTKQIERINEKPPHQWRLKRE